MESLCTSFAPVASPTCRALVLGSMPGAASLQASAYYAHPRNAFWPILYALWGAQGPPEAYAQRVAFALSHHVAIWDAAHSCLREGSSDASIREVVINDFPGLFAQCPNIRAIFFNGRLAQDLFEKHTPAFARDLPRQLLPSTSPAYTLPFDEKLTAWRALRAAIEQEMECHAEHDHAH